MPNWYAAVLSGSGQPKIIKYTEGENFKHAGTFDTPEKWKRKTKDVYNPPTVQDRYPVFLFTVGEINEIHDI